MRTVLANALVVLFAVHGYAQEKPDARRQWQDGTWANTERVSSYVGSGANATATTTGTTTTASGSAVPIHRVSQMFVIETADRWYIASQRWTWRWSKPVPMT